MKIYEGNLIAPIEDYQGKWALSPCGNVVSQDFNGKEGWFIVEPLKQYEKYVNGVLVIDTEKQNNDIKLKYYNEYQQKLLELKSEDEFNQFLLKTQAISQQIYETRLLTISSELATAKQTYLTNIGGIQIG